MKTAYSSPPEPLWTMSDLQRHLGLCNRSTRTLVRRGLIPTIRLSGKALRFNPAKVQAALERLTTGDAR